MKPSILMEHTGRALMLWLDWSPKISSGDFKPGQGIKTLCCIVGSIVVGFLFPLTCALYDRVATDQQVRATICGQDARNKASLEYVRASICTDALGDDASFPSTSRASTAHAARDSAEDEHAGSGHADKEPTAKPIIVGFFPGLSTAAWPLAFLVLSVALVWYAPARDDARMPRPVQFWLVTWATLATLTVGANFTRELATSFDESRRVFSHTNFDVAFSSALAYDALFFVLSGMISLIWTRWLGASRPDHKTKEIVDIDTAFMIEQTEHLSQSFDDWQHVSVLVVAAFIPGAFLYWQVVHTYHDLRYVFSAGVYHIMFALTWYFVSQPLLEHWSAWHKTRSRALAMLTGQVLESGAQRKHGATSTARNVTSEQLAALTAALKELQPVPKYSLIAAAVATTATVLAPLYQLAL